MIDTNLKIINWNVRGLNSPAHRETVLQLLKDTGPNLVCLQETKLQHINDMLALEFLGQRLNHLVYLPADGTKGGIVLAWDADLISVTNSTLGLYSLSATVHMRLSGTSFFMTVVYGPSEDPDKGNFLQELQSIKPDLATPWLCVGDFNLIYEARDKNNLNLNRRLMGQFRNTLDACELKEIVLHNRKYTWSNGQDNPTLVHLDRFFCNNDWDINYSTWGLQALSSSMSDHCPLFLCQQSTPPRKAKFKFECFWTKIPGFFEVVKEAWDRSAAGNNPMMILHNKLLNTAKALRSWSKILFGNARMQLHIVNEIILRLDEAQESRPLTTEEADLLRDLKVRVLGLAAVERSRRRQSSRLVWLKEGDACTRFFHLRMSARKRRNFIPALKNRDGNMLWSHAEKEQDAFDHYNSLLGSKAQRGCTFNWNSLNLSSINGSDLDNTFTENEIFDAISQMPSEKAPGPDGFTIVFYKSCWSIIKHSVVAAFHSLYNFNTGPLERLNTATICLIPKKEVAEYISDFRPISLIHSFAKIVSKVLALRLANKIDSLISPSQSAFIKKRCIQDNFLYVRNLARAYHRTRTSALLFKLDISKAFDTVSWEYLFELLEARGFSARWRNWIALILASSSSMVLLNGILGPKLHHQRGLRQGDPLSPYLFILAIDTLQRLFEIATEQGDLSQLRGRNAKLRLSLYADDAALFVNPCKEDVDLTMEIMNKFGDATGLKINMSKSLVLPIRCANLNLDNILTDFGGQRASFPISYLGLPLTLGRLRLVHLQPILDKAKAKMAGWQGKLMTPGGRRELVRSVLSSMPIYLLTAIKTQKQFIKEYDKARRRFLWAGNQEMHGGKCKVNWTKTCLPVDRGGLGVIDLERFSRALRLRWLWFSWTNPEKPWVGSEIPVDDTDRALFAAATKVTVLNGKKTSFWKSSWLNGQPPSELFPLLFKHSKRKNKTVAQALRMNSWVKDICYDLSFDLLTEFFMFWRLIDLEQIDLQSEEDDQMIWTRMATGIYTAKSAYDLQFEGTTFSACAPHTWRPWAPSKCKFFTWLLLQNRIWTADRLLQRGWPNEYFCPLCVRNLETVSHLFTECPFSRDLWTRVSTWAAYPIIAPSAWTTDEIQSWFLGLTEATNASGLRSLIILVIWTIWRERNARIFRGTRTTAGRLFEMLRDEAGLWLAAGAKGLASIVSNPFRE